MTPRHSNAESDDTRIVFKTANLTPLDVAAVTAVVTAALHEQASDLRVDGHPRSAWERSRRQLRAPLSPGAGAWRTFG